MVVEDYYEVRGVVYTKIANNVLDVPEVIVCLYQHSAVHERHCDHSEDD